MAHGPSGKAEAVRSLRLTLSREDGGEGSVQNYCKHLDGGTGAIAEIKAAKLRGSLVDPARSATSAINRSRRS
jgi:hypothetical protein